MSQQKIIQVTSTDEVLDEEGTFVGYSVGDFPGTDWKLSIAEGFIILNNHDGVSKIVLPAHRVREVEVSAYTPQVIEWTDEPVALVDPQGNEIAGS